MGMSPNEILKSYDGGEASITGNAAWDAPAHTRPPQARGGLIGAHPMDDERNEPPGDMI